MNVLGSSNQPIAIHNITDEEIAKPTVGRILFNCNGLFFNNKENKVRIRIHPAIRTVYVPDENTVKVCQGMPR